MARRTSPAIVITGISIVLFNLLTFGVPWVGTAVTALSSTMPAPFQGQVLLTASFLGLLLGVGFSFFLHPGATKKISHSVNRRRSAGSIGHFPAPRSTPNDVPHGSSTWRPLPPMFKYFGGKSRMAPRIIARIPEHNTFVEPFAGGANVTLQKPPSRHEVLADKRQDLLRFYRAVKNKQPIRVPAHSKEIFQRIRDKPEASRTPGEFVRLQGSSFGGHGQSYAEGGTGTRGLMLTKRIPLYRERLANTTILNSDYKSTIKRYDSPSTAFYLDPPYPTDRKGYTDYGRTIPTPREIKTTVAHVKGKVLISYPNLPSVTKEFKPPAWHIDRLKVQNAMYASTGGPKTRTELLISNYPARDRWQPETTLG